MQSLTAATGILSLFMTTVSVLTKAHSSNSFNILALFCLLANNLNVLPVLVSLSICLSDLFELMMMMMSSGLISEQFICYEVVNPVMNVRPV